MKTNLDKLKIICVIVFFLTGFSGKAQEMPAVKKQEITYVIIPAGNNTWGYDILMDKKLTIHQPSIPGVQGEMGFKTKADAEKIAKLVVGKMKKGEMPPNVSIEEMKKLKAI